MQHEFPMGDDFFEIVVAGEMGCETQTTRSLNDFGDKATICRQLLGNVLSLIYREACCFYGCDNGDHLPQRIAARITSHALSSIRLMNMGYYDESLTITRSIGEMANLLFLFAFKPAYFEKWKIADDSARWKDFRPKKVRDALKAAMLPIPIDEQRYKLLSSIVVHLAPDVTPQAHQPQTHPTVGSVFRAENFVVGLNELAAATGVAAAGLLPMLPGNRKEQVKTATVDLLRSIGSLDLAAIKQMGL